MNRTKIILLSMLVLSTITGTLFYNKSKMAGKSENGALKSIPVSAAAVGKMKLASTQLFTGTISANNDVSIISETEGRVTAVLANVGDYKEAGAVLVQVDDELKKAAYATAEVNYEKSRKDVERFESLHARHAVTDQQYENARLAYKSAEAQYIVARRQYNDTKITTPISGVVTSRPVNIGTMVQSKMPVANVVDISKLKVKLNVAEKDVFRLNAGDQATVTTSVYPGVSFSGGIETISAKSDEAHTYPVEISLRNSKEHPLRAGMFASVSFTSLSREDVVVIPRAALIGSAKKPQVFIIDGGLAKLRDIVVDGEAGTNLAVRSGLREGETVVINGQNNLKDNVPVTIVE